MTMGLLGPSVRVHRGERAGAGQDTRAQRPDADFQGWEPAPLTCSEMPVLLNGEQLGRAPHSSPCQEDRVNPAPEAMASLRPCPCSSLSGPDPAP